MTTYPIHMCSTPDDLQPGWSFTCPVCGQGWTARLWWQRDQPMHSLDGRIVPQLDPAFQQQTRNSAELKGHPGEIKTGWL